MNEPEPLVILIEDEAQIRRFLRLTLADKGFRLLEASTGEEGISRVKANQPALVLLDLGLPDMDGTAVAARIRADSNIPIIVLSARDQEEDKIRALDAGADDYVTKPFGIGELLARMRASLRRASLVPEEDRSSIFESETLKVDLSFRSVIVNGAEVHLTPTEFSLLEQLLRNSDRVITHKQLLKAVWGDQYAGEKHYLRVYMAQLRHKLESDPARPRHIITEPGVGYRFRL